MSIVSEVDKKSNKNKHMSQPYSYCTVAVLKSNFFLENFYLHQKMTPSSAQRKIAVTCFSDCPKLLGFKMLLQAVLMMFCDSITRVVCVVPVAGRKTSVHKVAFHCFHFNCWCRKCVILLYIVLYSRVYRYYLRRVCYLTILQSISLLSSVSLYFAISLSYTIKMI